MAILPSFSFYYWIPVHVCSKNRTKLTIDCDLKRGQFAEIAKEKFFTIIEIPKI